MDESRVEALRLAKDFLYRKPNATESEVVSLAQKFYEFLIAKDD
jgi:hypothetical protein